MAEQVYGFYKDVAKQLRDLVRGGGDSVGSPNLPQNQRYIAIALTNSAISGRSGTTCGTGTVTLCDIGSTGGITTTSITETAINISCDEVPADAYLKITKEYVGGQWVIDQAYITNLRLDGSNLQYRKNCTWTTWTTGTDCPE
jgi:hypothetical protein